MGNCSGSNLKELEKCNLKNTEPITYNFTKAKVLKVYDGDSITIAAYYDKGYKKFNVRIFGIDCDEMRGGTEQSRESAQRAKAFVERAVLGKIVDIEVLNNKFINDKKIVEKYGRLLAKIKMPDGQDLAEALFIAGLARKYYGGKKDNKPLFNSVSSD
jgi:endonuclease YncB( thermonuclease family)